jgi:hypothetical protein|tara:strand:+ start:207 stop:428 length:222 start_codon:yes stop_codon:yes gene_type:complete
MKFISGEQLKYRKAIKDGKVVEKTRDNLITIPDGTTISFGDMIEDRGRYSIVMTVVKDFGSGNVSKSTTLTLS